MMFKAIAAVIWAPGVMHGLIIGLAILVAMLALAILVSKRLTIMSGSMPSVVRKRTDDLAELVEGSVEAIHIALSDGDGHHPPGSWADETRENHIRHMREHLNEFERTGRFTDLTHLHCRSSLLIGQVRRKVGSLRVG